MSAKSKSQQTTSAKKIKHLVKLKSIGPEFATVLVGEVFYRTFNNRKQIGSYVGLTPSPFQSGSTSRDQGMSRAGNAKARTTMIELGRVLINAEMSGFGREAEIICSIRALPLVTLS